jgi:hypothetical protein
LIRRQEKNNDKMRGRRKYESLKKTKCNARRWKGEWTSKVEKGRKLKKMKRKKKNMKVTKKHMIMIL